jgi:hypothetical protein
MSRFVLHDKTGTDRTPPYRGVRCPGVLNSLKTKAKIGMTEQYVWFL